MSCGIIITTMYKFGKDESMKSLPADNIHQRLCDLRNGTGKSQKEVADELNIQASVLSRIECGETKSVSHDLIIKFAEYYNVS